MKILIAGGFGVGKTTFVGSVSEIAPLTTEETLTAASVDTDNLTGVEGKTTTTVAMDFGRVTIGPSQHHNQRHSDQQTRGQDGGQDDIVLYLFGTPGQERFWFMWDELCRGALGAVVLADTRRLSDCFGAIEFFESRGVRFVVAVNNFDGAYRYRCDELRAALSIADDVAVVQCDARDSRLSAGVLISLLEQLLAAKRPAALPAPAAPHAATAPTAHTASTRSQ